MEGYRRRIFRWQGETDMAAQFERTLEYCMPMAGTYLTLQPIAVRAIAATRDLNALTDHGEYVSFQRRLGVAMCSVPMENLARIRYLLGVLEQAKVKYEFPKDDHGGLVFEIAALTAPAVPSKGESGKNEIKK